jgi:hypothetical protein
VGGARGDDYRTAGLSPELNEATSLSALATMHHQREQKGDRSGPKKGPATRKWCINYVVVQVNQRGTRNEVERRFAPASKEVACLVLPHEHHGPHLSAGGKTTDEALEKKNFAKAGEVLTAAWSGISRTPVTCYPSSLPSTHAFLRTVSPPLLRLSCRRQLHHRGP